MNPWAMRNTVEVVHRPDNWVVLEWAQFKR